jgi:hypothetical protein
LTWFLNLSCQISPHCSLPRLRNFSIIGGQYSFPYVSSMLSDIKMNANPCMWYSNIADLPYCLYYKPLSCCTKYSTISLLRILWKLARTIQAFTFIWQTKSRISVLWGLNITYDNSLLWNRTRQSMTITAWIHHERISDTSSYANDVQASKIKHLTIWNYHWSSKGWMRELIE